MDTAATMAPVLTGLLAVTAPGPVGAGNTMTGSVGLDLFGRTSKVGELGVDGRRHNRCDVVR